MWIRNLFKYSLIEDKPFATFVFIMMQLVGIWSICGLTFASKNNK